MPKLNILHLESRIQERIAQLERGDALEARDINALLTKEQQHKLKESWAEQQRLRKVKKPKALNNYELLHKQAAVLLGKCLKSPTTSAAERKTLQGLQTKCANAICMAHKEIDLQFILSEQIAKWVDREITALTEFELSGDTIKQIEENNTKLKQAYAQLPILVTSRSPDKLVSEQERFGWKTIRDVRLEIFSQALADLQDGLVAGMEKLQRDSEVRAARVFMDVYTNAEKDGKNGWTNGNNALKRSGFNRLDGLNNNVGSKRDREVREMEDKLRLQLENEQNDSEQN